MKLRTKKERTLKAQYTAPYIKGQLINPMNKNKYSINGIPCLCLDRSKFLGKTLPMFNSMSWLIEGTRITGIEKVAENIQVAMLKRDGDEAYEDQEKKKT